MARIQLQFPSKTVYTTEINVRVTDLNYGAHVGNDRMLALMQEARIHLYRSLGIKDEVHIDADVGQIITDAAVVYRSEAFLGDVLVFELALEDFNKYGFDMYYRVINKATRNEVALGKTGIVCFNYVTRKVSAMPANFLQKLKSLEYDN